MHCHKVFNCGATFEPIPSDNCCRVCGKVIRHGEDYVRIAYQGTLVLVCSIACDKKFTAQHEINVINILRQ